MKTKYTVNYFIKKFRAIPENKWCIGEYKKGERFCAYGFCGCRNGNENTPESDSLQIIFNKYRIRVSFTNDGKADWPDYTTQIFGNTPKERILTTLENIKYLQS